MDLLTADTVLVLCVMCGSAVSESVLRCEACDTGTVRPWTPVEDDSLTLATLGPPLISFVVHGAPGPQGSKDTFRTKTGKTRTVESSKKVKPWRQDVVAAALDAKPAGWVPLAGPAVLDLVFTMHRPKNRSIHKRFYPSVTPDIDKLVRSTLDGIKTAGVYEDDGRVIAFRRLREFYAGDPDRDALPAGETGAVIRVWELPILPLIIGALA